MSSRRPISMPLIALLALVLAIGSFSGAAVGAPLTTKAVKKIAAKVVKKKAKHLHVARAKDSDRLGGLPPESYQGRVAFAGMPDLSQPVTGSTVIPLESVSLSVPVPGAFVRVTGSVSMASTSDSGQNTVWAAVDTDCSTPSGVGYGLRSQMAMPTNRDQGTTDFVTALPTGVHLITLCIDPTVNGTVFDPTLVAQSIARGASGSTP